jgi:hypothetical protein
MKNILTTALVAVVVASGSLALFDRPETKVIDRTVTEQVGAMASPEVYSYMNVHGAFTQGGRINATSTAASTQALETTDLMEYSILNVTNTVNTTFTLTLPATSTMKDAIIPDAGQSRTWVLNNASSSVTAMTIAAGTGIDLLEPNTGDDFNVVIADRALLTCWREANTDVSCLVTEVSAAD